MNGALRGVLKRLHYPLAIMLTCVRCYVAYPLSLHHIEEIIHERGVKVDHTTIHRWCLKILPVLAETFRRRWRLVGDGWRMDETYALVGGQWKHLYHAVDKHGHTVDFLPTARRDLAAACRMPLRGTCDRSEWLASQDHHRQERCQYRCYQKHCG